MESEKSEFSSLHSISDLPERHQFPALVNWAVRV